MTRAKSSEKGLQQLITAILETVAPHFGGALVDISFVTSGKSRQLNQKYRRQDTATDVLSFPMYTHDDLETVLQEAWLESKEPLLLGSLVLCQEIIQKYAEEQKKTFDEYLEWSIRHGLKHLLGYDHNPDGSDWFPAKENIL